VQTQNKPPDLRSESVDDALTSDDPAKEDVAETETETQEERPSREQNLSVSAKPQWEFGVGGGAFSGLDYPASNDTNRRAIILPFFIYRTPLFRFGGSGVRAVAIERPRVKLDLSVGGSLNASSDGDGVRQGLPDLDFLFELGPQLEFRLFEHRLASGAYWQSRFTSELRAVFSTDFGGVDARGYVAELGVGANLRNILGGRVDLLSGIDFTYASERLQDYFYEVSPQFETDSRPVFDAKAGYLESNLVIGAAFKPWRRVRIFVAIAKGFFAGAANEDSPLFEITEQTRYALGVVWTLKTSDKMIDVVDLGSAQ
jgi:outer membrane scaffolding protein for murein synthesis (MipA/OmpV family)